MLRLVCVAAAIGAALTPVALAADPGLSEAFRVGDVDGDAHLDAAEFEGAVASLYRIGAEAKGGGGGGLGGGLASPAALAADPKFTAAFVNSLGMIWATEIGDKTFFIAAILAMRHSRTVVFLGALGALAVMTVLSAAMGFALPSLLPRTYTHYASALLFFYFGCRMLKDASTAEAGVSDELEEVEEELGVGSGKKGDDAEAGAASGSDSPEKAGSAAPKAAAGVLSQAFVLTFLAEWGDRSQIATISLASARDPFGVTAGGIVGHACCTGLAVLGGRALASRISEKHVALAGGVVFLVFAVYAFFFEDTADLA